MDTKKNITRKAMLISLVLIFGTFAAGCGVLNIGQEVTADTETVTETVVALAEETVIEGELVPMANVPGATTAVSIFLEPTASGITLLKSKSVVLEASNANQGYVMLKYTGTNPKIKVQVTKGTGTTYTYNLNARNAYEVFPLTDGDGTYGVKVFENISGTKYSQAFSKTITVKLTNQFLPFLYPNQYVNFSAGSKTVAKGLEVTKGVTDDLKKVEKVYNYVVTNFTYDKEKAATVKSGYLPEVDQILALKKGICFDYAAVMATMLRSQNIPCKLVIGYTGDAYHAWINVYSAKTGWVDGMIFFDGNKWQLMDPTFASSSKKSSSVMKYIGTGSNYTSKYTY